jgi:hypothetical protein
LKEKIAEILVFSERGGRGRGVKEVKIDREKCER